MRKLSLFTAIALGISALLASIQPGSNLIATICQIPGNSIWAWISVVSTAGVIAIVVIVPLLFFVALYRDQATLSISRPLRLLGRAAALVLGIMLADSLSWRFSAFMSDWADTRKLPWRAGAAGVLNAVRDPVTIATVRNLMDLLSSTLLIALLIVLTRDDSDAPLPDIPVGSLLRQISAMAVIALGLAVVVQLFRTGLAPWTYLQLRDYAYQTARTPPHLADLLLPQIHSLAAVSAIFVIPFLVYKASHK